MSFESYNPPSTLKVPQHPVTRAKFPFIDIHSHQGGINKSKIDQLRGEMDELNMGIMINLSGRGYGQGNSNAQQQYIKSMMQEFKTHAPGRFMVFTNLNFNGFGTPEWTALSSEGISGRCGCRCSRLEDLQELGLDFQGQ